MALFSTRKETSYIVVHSSATKASMDVGAKEIKDWHRMQGYVDIGYHFVIRRDGTVEKGRDVDVAGAHVKGYNSRSVGICMVGGLDKAGKAENNYTHEQFSSLEKLVKEMLTKYKGAKVLGHRDFPAVAKDCPCFSVREWWKSVND